MTVDDHGLARALETLGKRGLVRAERKGISEHVKKVRSVARAQADFNQGSITGRTLMKRGLPTGKVRITDYKLRFYAAGVAAGGTAERHTRRGFNRGVEAADPFMERTAAATDPLLSGKIRETIDDAIRRAGVG